MPNSDGATGGISEVDLTQNGQQLDPSAGEPVSSMKFQVQVVGERQVPQQLALLLRNGEHRVVVASQVDAKGECTFVHFPPGKYDLMAATPSSYYAVTEIATNGSTSAVIRWKSLPVQPSKARLRSSPEPELFVALPSTTAKASLV